MQKARGESGIGIGRQLPARDCLFQDALDVRQAVAPVALLAPGEIRQLARELGMEYHLEDRLSARVGRQPGEGRDCERTHRSQRIVVRLAACLDQHGVQRRSCALAHGAE